jgi:hypothetical protein
MNLRDPWLLIAVGALCVVVPIWLSHWDSSRPGKPGSIRDRVQGAVRSEPATSHFISGLRIGIEIAGVILIGIGVMRMLGVSV